MRVAYLNNKLIEEGKKKTQSTKPTSAIIKNVDFSSYYKSFEDDCKLKAIKSDIRVEVTPAVLLSLPQFKGVQIKLF